MPDTKFLDSEEITLRPVELEDSEFLRNTRIHKDVRDYMIGEPKPLNMKQQREYIESLGSDDINLLIEHQGEKAGTIFLNNWNKIYKRCEFGIFLHPDFHGKGIGTKSLEIFLEYLFEELNMQKVSGGFLEGNTGSKRIMEKNEFTKEGRKRQHKYVNGEWKDEIRMSLLKNEWRQQK